jgi:Arm DNA-binding domain
MTSSGPCRTQWSVVGTDIELTREWKVSERERLTEKLVHGLPAPSNGSQIYWDAPDDRGKGHVPGFGLRVTAGGVRAYVLNYTTHTGRGRRYTIGRAAVWTLTAARQEAADLKRRVDQCCSPRMTGHGHELP